MKENIKLGCTLLIITALAGLILSFAYDITRKPIEARALEEKSAAMKVVLQAEEFAPVEESNLPENITGIYEAKNGGANAGYVFTLNTKGYGGNIEMMVGINADSTISGIDILKHTETPGLGAKAKEDPSFGEQFKGVSADKAISLGSDVQAITGATITSTGVTNGVNEAIEYFNSNLKGAK